MRREVGRLVKHSGLYGLGTILSKSVGFLMIPVYTRYLAPRDYGVLEILDLTVFFGGIFSMMGIQSAFFRFYAACETAEEKRLVVSTAQLATAGISLFVVLIIQIVSGTLSAFTFGTDDYAPLVRLVAFTLFFSNLSEVPLAHLRAQERTSLFVAIGLARTALNASLVVVALVVLGKGVEGILWANLLANVLAGCGLFGFQLSRSGLGLSRARLEAMLGYGAPLVVPSLASFVLVFSDRLFLRHYAALTEVGIYGLAYKLASIVPLVATGPFGMAWAWQQFELAKHGERAIYARIQTYQMIVAAFVALAVSVWSQDVLRLMTPDSYWGASRLIPLIASCYVLEGMRAVVNSGILIRKVTHQLALIGVVVAVADLLLNYLLIPRYHAVGAAVATLVAYGLSLTMSYLAARRVFPVRFEYWRGAAILGSATVLYLLRRLVELPLLSSVAMGALLLLVFLCVCLAVLDQREREFLWAHAAGTTHRVAAFIGSRYGSERE